MSIIDFLVLASQKRPKGNPNPWGPDRLIELKITNYFTIQ